MKGRIQANGLELCGISTPLLQLRKYNIPWIYHSLYIKQWSQKTKNYCPNQCFYTTLNFLEKLLYHFSYRNRDLIKHGNLYVSIYSHPVAFNVNLIEMRETLFVTLVQNISNIHLQALLCLISHKFIEIAWMAKGSILYLIHY